MRRALAKIAIAVIVILVVAASSTFYYVYYVAVPPKAPQAPQTNYTIIYAFPYEMTTLDPSTDFSSSLAIFPNVYETLTYYNWTTEQLTPLLATSWNGTQDGLHWTFHLRQGVLFHDGTPFNSTAVVYSINRTMTLGQGAAYIWAAVQAVVPVDTYDVRFDLSYPANIPLIASASYAAYMISPNIQTIYHPPGNISSWFNSGHDDGTGPYVVKTWAPATQVVLTKFDQYWRGWNPNQFSTAVIQISADSVTREQMVESSDVVTWFLPLSDISKLQSNPSVQVFTGAQPYNYYAQFNTVKPPLNNVLVRQALSYALPYDQIIHSLAFGFATQSFGIVPKGMWGYNDSLPQYSFNLTKAQALLAEAGYNAQNPLPPLTITYEISDPIEQGIAVLWSQNLKFIGVTLNTKGMLWDDMWALATNGNPLQAQDIFIGSWYPTYDTPYDFLFNVFHSESPPVFNLAYWNNSEYDHLIDQAFKLEGTQPSTALQMYNEAQVVLINQAPGVFIFDEDYVYVVNSQVKGFSYNAAYTTVVFFYNLHV